MEETAEPELERALLLHLLDHRGNQVRFEADQWTTEFGIFRAFAHVEMTEIKNALRGLEMSRSIYRRVQYVIGYSEPKLVYSLTPSGHRKAIDLQRGVSGAAAPSDATAESIARPPEDDEAPEPPEPPQPEEAAESPSTSPGIDASPPRGP